MCHVDADGLQLHYSVRSNVDAQRVSLVEKVRQTAAGFGAEVETSGAYPAWQYRKDSPLRDAASGASLSVFDLTATDYA